ncbi:MAG: DsrH/TusB family sulfur metabolism protein [Promethearchaeota archaeon]|jgi:sulfur relay protein TusB/DsrH
MTENLDIVYLFGFSGLTGNHLRRLLPILKSQIKKNTRLGIILIHDGVIGITTKGQIPKQMEELLNLDVAVFAIKADVIARGITLDYVHNKIKTIDYADLIDVIDVTPKIISWM